MILIGVDPHKSSHTAVAVDPAGHLVAQRRFVVNAGTFRQLMRWCEQWPERRFAVEGARGLGRTLAQQLAAAGDNVVDVPSTLSARARLLTTGGDRKTDAKDAFHVAQVALFRHDLRPVEPEDQTTILRLLTERHDDLVHERTRVLNRLHAVLRDLLPGGAPTGLSADKAAVAMKAIRAVTATDACRRDIARNLLADLRRLDRQVKDNEAEMRDALAVTRTGLTTLPGLGTVLAAKVIGHVGDVSRFPTEHHFARYTGSAPLDASSGNNVRHRLNTRRSASRNSSTRPTRSLSR
ncbi:IS110 family transposase [Streptomyces scabichelini]|uniref:IS110 family transposase n=1 Tax=Streptomyces scabichelini TaxID=2711217 RepID=UPI0030BA0EC0